MMPESRSGPLLEGASLSVTTGANRKNDQEEMLEKRDADREELTARLKAIQDQMETNQAETKANQEEMKNTQAEMKDD
jgi:hypothetical protein